MAAEQGRDLSFPRRAIDFLFLPLVSLAVIKTYTAVFIKKKEVLQEGIGIISVLHE